MHPMPTLQTLHFHPMSPHNRQCPSGCKLDTPAPATKRWNFLAQRYIMQMLVSTKMLVRRDAEDSKTLGAIQNRIQQQKRQDADL